MYSLLNISHISYLFLLSDIAKDDKLGQTSNKKLIINISTFHCHSHAPFKNQISAINFPFWIAIKTTSGLCCYQIYSRKSLGKLVLSLDLRIKAC